MWEKQTQINSSLTTFMFLFNRNFWDVLSGDVLVWWQNGFFTPVGAGSCAGAVCAPAGLRVQGQDGQLQLPPCTINSCWAVLTREHCTAWKLHVLAEVKYVPLSRHWQPTQHLLVLVAFVLAYSKRTSVFMDRLHYVQITGKGLTWELMDGRSGVVFCMSPLMLKVRNT